MPREEVGPECPLYVEWQFVSADMEVECGCVAHALHGPKCRAKLTGRVEVPRPAWLQEGMDRLAAERRGVVIEMPRPVEIVMVAA